MPKSTDITSPSVYGLLYDLLLPIPMAGVRVTDAQLRVLPLIGKRPALTLDAMATECGIKATTISTYIGTLIRAGHSIWRADLERLFGVSQKVFERIESCLPNGIEMLSVQLRQIKDQLSEVITWDQIRSVLAYRSVREHLRLQGVEFVEPDIFYGAGDRQVGAEDDKENASACEDSENNLNAEFADDGDIMAEFDDELHMKSDDLEEMLEDLNLPQRESTEPEAISLENTMIDEDDDYLFDGLDVKQTDVEQSAMETNKPEKTSPAVSLKRSLPSATRRVCYEADSDEEDNGENAAETATATKRVLPAWMLMNAAVKSNGDAEQPFSAALLKRKKMF